VPDADLFRALTLLLAMSEQVLLELERVDALPDPELVQSVIAARDAAYQELSSTRFADRRPVRVDV
jgi:hypothetical protein